MSKENYIEVENKNNSIIIMYYFIRIYIINLIPNFKYYKTA